MGIWRINVSYGVTEKKQPLTLKINLSHAICNSKNEDTVFSCYLYAKFFFFLHFCCHIIGHSPIFICQLPIYIYIYI